MIASNTTFIVAAYGITWVVILGYMFRLVVTSQRARSALVRVQTSQPGESRP